MTDRELLELAAKAAGINLEDHQPVLALDGKSYLPPVLGRWEPLNSDRDAFRLAVDLGMHITSSQTHAWVSTPEVDAIQPFEGNPLKATRRAIVRVAAAIQQAKEAQ